RSLEQSDQWHSRHPLSEEPNAADVRWIVRRRDAIESLHRPYDRLVKADAAVDAASNDRLEADSSQFAFVLDVTAFLKLEQAIPNRLGIIGHPLKAALVQKAFLAVRKIEQAPLERGR